MLKTNLHYQNDDFLVLFRFLLLYPYPSYPYPSISLPVDSSEGWKKENTKGTWENTREEKKEQNRQEKWENRQEKWENKREKLENPRGNMQDFPVGSVWL